ncbi:thioredoxin family protein [Luteolibacter pohnpeiensis]|uniref:Thioredoxin family protein n=1 Tax=Luteolibacter pohnpeiensis TaxID=454153 RepID=A0A934S7W1_9BACT|nr:thioredoxin family protein [Luteolibacter pohnpeiensis]MBK1882930.1 thioredoxin family protein [Luteolibacter pohnpeiensis]
MAEVLSTFNLKPGDAAPDFTLPNAKGQLATLAGCLGKGGLLVVFACNHCPFVVHLAAALADFAREVSAFEIGTVAINSNDLEKYPQDGPEKMEEFAAEYGWDFPYLLDESQEVARAYGAACTPDFFLFDGDGKLVYAGQFDGTRPRSGDQPDGADLRNAVKRMLAGDLPIENVYPSSGCNIKWKVGNAPSWWSTPS